MSTPRIVVGVDGSQEARGALRCAVDQAVATGAEIDAVMATDTAEGYLHGGYGFTEMAEAREDEEKLLNDALNSLPHKGIRVTGHVRTGDAAIVLLEAVHSAES